MVNETIIKEIEEVKLENPVILEGLPGIGFVGKIVVDEIIKQFDATKFAELNSDYFPPQVTMKNNGLIEHMKNEFYYIKGLGDDNQDVVLLTGNTQGADFEGQIAICKVLIDYFEDLGAEKIFTLGGLGTGDMVKNSRVFVAANNMDSLNEVLNIENSEIRKDDGGAIIGASGLLLFYAEEKGIPGTCLMGETPGFYIDDAAAKSVIKVLFELLNFDMDLSDVDERIEDTLEKITASQNINPMTFEPPKPKPSDDLQYIG